jgi:putative lipoprotein
VDINLVPVGSIGNSGNNNNNSNSIIRGTISYRERIALPNNASITVRLVSEAVSNAPANAQNVIAETTFNSNNRQVPIPFELTYNGNLIDARQNYYLQAFISVDGRTTFATNTNYAVLTNGNPNDNLQLVLFQGTATTNPNTNVITGQTLSLSKFGTGTIQIEGRASEFLLRANIDIKTDGAATVVVSRFSGGIPFVGKLIYFDETTMRIAVESSGNANASGEIEIKYTGRRIDSVTGSNLMLDGQKLTLKF